jgi:ABC-type microcin C transport system permease subunit YejB
LGGMSQRRLGAWLVHLLKPFTTVLVSRRLVKAVRSDSLFSLWSATFVEADAMSQMALGMILVVNFRADPMVQLSR